jgi:hypothetical protein
MTESLCSIASRRVGLDEKAQPGGHGGPARQRGERGRPRTRREVVTTAGLASGLAAGLAAGLRRGPPSRSCKHGRSRCRRYPQAYGTTGHITYYPAHLDRACRSKITYNDGDEGVLLHAATGSRPGREEQLPQPPISSSSASCRPPPSTPPHQWCDLPHHDPRPDQLPLRGFRATPIRWRYGGGGGSPFPPSFTRTWTPTTRITG